MADSDNSRTLSSSIQRNLLPAAEECLTKKATAIQSGDAGTIDPAIAKWSTWLAAHHEFARLCQLQQRLETKLLRTVASPQVEIRFPGRKEPIIVEAEEEIDAWLQGDEFADARARAKAELQGRRANWNAADRHIGYSRAQASEEAASKLEVELAERLWSTPSGSIVGAAAKLHAILRHGAPEPDTDEFPWPQIRSVLIDLLCLSKGGSFTSSGCP